MTKGVDFPQFVIVWNKTQGMETPELHVRISRWLADSWRRGRRELLLLAFRDSGKSTLVGLFCAWLLATDPRLRILVLAADLALARKMVRNVKRIIERHPLTRGLKPSRADQWASDRFTVRRRVEYRDPSMLAKGIGANITGSRADIVICDDVEVPNTCDSARKRRDLRDRLLEVSYVLTPGGLQLFVGTPHTHYTIYADKARREAGENQVFLSGFRRLEIPVADKRGRSAWPERFAPDKIEDLKRRTGPNKFASQMMLKPMSLAEGRLEPEKIRPYSQDIDYREANGEATMMLGSSKLVSASCWWDPAFGMPGKGDASVIAAVFTSDQGDYYLHRIQYLQHDPGRVDEVDEATQLCGQVADFVSDLYLPAVILETNGLGRFLPSLLRRELASGGLTAAVVEATTTRDKSLRIVDAFDAPLAAGRFHAHDGVWDTPFIAEMREWAPGRGGRDDGLDAVSGCLLSEPVRLPRTPRPKASEARAGANWRPGSRGFRAKTGFKV